jgi:hypothetical protein
VSGEPARRARARPGPAVAVRRVSGAVAPQPAGLPRRFSFPLPLDAASRRVILLPLFDTRNSLCGHC